MKAFFWRSLPLLLLLSFGGLLVMVSGIVPMKASSGHFAVTEAVLQFAKRRSIATHTIGGEPLPLDAPWLVLKGAGHYETGCRPCHGSPELKHPRVARAMLPPPPYLPDQRDAWEPDELFYIVKHGLKFTGMPAWPAPGRDDEVEAVVAFVLEMPELDAEEYRRLVHGETERGGSAAPLPDLTPDDVTTTCARCHGVDGKGRGNAAFPSIAGQNEEYLYASMAAYERSERNSGIMEPIAAGLTEDEMRRLATYFAGMPGRDGDAAAAADPVIAEGKRIAETGVPDRRIPSCSDCHGPAPERRNPAYPELAGQYAEYLELQLKLFADGVRGGTRYADLMDPVSHRLEAAERRAVARYYASLPAE